MKKNRLAGLIKYVINDLLNDYTYKTTYEQYSKFEISKISEGDFGRTDLKVFNVYIDYKKLNIKRSQYFELVIETEVKKEFDIDILIINYDSNEDEEVISESKEKNTNILRFLNHILNELVKNHEGNHKVVLNKLFEFAVKETEFLPPVKNEMVDSGSLYVVYFDKDWDDILDLFLYSKEYNQITNTFQEETGIKLIFTTYWK